MGQLLLRNTEIYPQFTAEPWKPGNLADFSFISLQSAVENQGNYQ